MIAYRTLTGLDFAGIIAEAQAQTTTGSEFLNQYKRAFMGSPVSHALINAFVNESKNYRYDSGVTNAACKIAEYINENQYSWQLATACERIHASGSRYNTLNENAAKQVECLIEMQESDVVNYIKAGALKNVMFVESFRNIARSVFRDMPVAEVNENYNVTHPISYTESKDGKTYFSIHNRLFVIEGEKLSEANWKEVSEDFRQITSLINSKEAKFVNEEFIYDNGKFKCTISEQGKCVRESKGSKYALTADQLRENNNLYLSTMLPTNRVRQAGILDTIVKICENFDNLTVLDNAGIYTTKNDRFAVVEHNGEASAFLIESSKNPTPWATTDNVLNVVNFIKKHTNTDLSESFSVKIEKVIEERSAQEQEDIKKQVLENSISDRKQKVAKLTEQFKNDPVRLAILARVAEDLNKLQ